MTQPAKKVDTKSKSIQCEILNKDMMLDREQTSSTLIAQPAEIPEEFYNLMDRMNKADPRDRDFLNKARMQQRDSLELTNKLISDSNAQKLKRDSMEYDKPICDINEQFLEQAYDKVR